jgi:hypothetical protein
MKRIVLLTCVLAVATLASAQLYKYVDKNGKTVYTDQPPPDADPKAMKISPSSTASAPGKTAVQQDKDLQKGRDKAAESGKKADETAARERQQAELCQTATMAYNTYAQGGRITKLDQNGEKIYLGDAEIDAARESAKQKMDEVCKKG